jgi:hypothetical protein
MDKNFDWQTEDTVEWDKLPPIVPAETEKATGRRRARPVWWLLLLGLLLIGGWLALQQITTRVAEVEAEATADLLATHDLLLQAVTDQDKDITRSLLSGREAAWLAAQTDLVEANVWLERTSLGLAYREAPATAVTVTLSTDLFSADMVYDVVYESETAEPVTLQQTAVYRRGVDRWLYAPPEADYWGDWQEQEYPRLTLSYPQRDADLAQRLGVDLSQAITDLCLQVEGMHCPADFRVRLRLDTQPESLLDLAAAILPPDQHAYHYRLPTPTLVGRPLDEAGYAALRQGYTVRLLGGLVADQTNYTCCRQVVLFQALLDYQLSQIGLKEWPLNESHYRQLIDRDDLPPGLGLAYFWRTEGPAILSSGDGWLVYLLAEYLLREGDYRSAAAWQQLLDTPQELYTLLETVAILSQSSPGYQQIARQLRSYAYIQTLAQESSAEPPQPLPAQDLLLACLTSTDYDPAPTIRLLRYSPATDAWRVEADYTGYPVLYAGPDEDGVILLDVEQSGSSGELRISWWRDGNFQRLSPRETSMYITGMGSPDGRFLVVIQFSTEFAETWSSWPVLLDLAACDEAGCQTHPLEDSEGGLVWSPNSRRTLILDEIEIAGPNTLFSLWIGDEQGQPLGPALVTEVGTEVGPALVTEVGTEAIPLARSPFWVDDETFGYVTLDEADREMVMLVSGESSQVLIEPGRFMDESIAFVMANPHQPHHYLIQLRHNNWGSRLVSYNALTEAITATISTDYNPLPVVSGDYLLLSQQSDNQPYQFLSAYNLRQATSHTYELAGNGRLFPDRQLSAAASGEWLALLLNERTLLLALPHLSYQRLIEHPNLQNCYGLAWVN